MDFSTAGAEADHSLHLAPHNHHFNPQQGSGSPAFSPFRHPAVSAIDPTLESTASSSRPQLGVHPSPSPHVIHQHHDNGTINPQHVPQSFYGDMARTSVTPSTPSNAASPRYPGVSPSQQKHLLQPCAPHDRSLPSRGASDDSIDDAYAAFVLYCNPSFPTSTDTSELKKAFRAPPKSDGKSFSVWALFELIRKFEQKEIKTWTQLALDLGVEPPSVEKGQSTQKVQQYSVRLKRWMRAMHIDAFFEYLLGKQHSYYLHIPPLHAPFPENGRDGVPLEEDLAIRALDPKFRPKRGRRKADEQDDEMDGLSTPPPKRPQLDTSLAFGNDNGFGQPQSAFSHGAIPMSAHPDDMDRFVNQDPWATAPAATAKGLSPHSAATATGGQQIRWRLNTQDLPTTPHPLSAITPSTTHPDTAFDEPHSAITPSTSKSRRRRHGPAVSSAWPSNANNSSGKLRGRPPSNRSVRDGPYVTFPANPKTKEGPTIDLNRPTVPSPAMERTASESDIPAQPQHFRFPPTPASAVSVSGPSQLSSQGRPERLHLQVPQHVGGPVHLVTPTLLVNGESDATPTLAPSALSSGSRRSSTNFFDDSGAEDAVDPDAAFSIVPRATTTPQRDTPRYPSSLSFQPTQPASLPHQQSPVPSQQSPHLPGPTHEDLKRTLAAELLRAEITGRKRLRGTEAKSLADAILKRLLRGGGEQGFGHTFQQSLEACAEKAAFRIACAGWLGLGSLIGLSAGATGAGVKRVSVRRFRVSSDGYESPVDEDEDSVDPGVGDKASRDADGGAVKEVFDISWTLLLSGLTAEFKVQGVVLDGTDIGDMGLGGEGMENGEEDLSEKVRVLKEKLSAKEEEMRRLRERILEAAF